MARQVSQPSRDRTGRTYEADKSWCVSMRQFPGPSQPGTTGKSLQSRCICRVSEKPRWEGLTGRFNERLSSPSGACLLSGLELPKKTAHIHPNYPARPDLLLSRKLGTFVESANTTGRRADARRLNEHFCCVWILDLQ